MKKSKDKTKPIVQVTVDFSLEMFSKLGKIAQAANVSRQAVVKMLLWDKLIRMEQNACLGKNDVASCRAKKESKSGS